MFLYILFLKVTEKLYIFRTVQRVYFLNGSECGGVQDELWMKGCDFQLDETGFHCGENKMFLFGYLAFSFSN